MHKEHLKTNITQNGFTLIELIIVIVILGILAVTAAPRFIDISTDSNISALKGMGGSIDSLATLVNAKAAIQGLNKSASAVIDLDNDGVGDVNTAYGYPTAARTNGIASILGDDFNEHWSWATNNSESVFYVGTASRIGSSGFYINGSKHTAANCYISYRNATGFASKPSIEYITDGC